MITDPKSYNDTALMLRYLTLGQLAWDGVKDEHLGRLREKVRAEILRRITIGEHNSP